MKNQKKILVLTKSVEKFFEKRHDYAFYPVIEMMKEKNKHSIKVYFYENQNDIDIVYDDTHNEVRGFDKCYHLYISYDVAWDNIFHNALIVRKPEIE